MMRLSRLAARFPLAVAADGEFASLGMVGGSGERMLTLLYDPRFLPRLQDNRAVACVLTLPGLAAELPADVGVACADDPAATFYAIHDYLDRETDFYWKDFASDISAEARIHPTAFVAQRNVRIGAGSLIEPRVTVLERTIIGRGVVVRAGTVIGGEGFEPKSVAGRKIVVAHAGGVRLADGVEIQSNCHVARAVFGGFTEIGEETKLDAMVHVAHGVRIGRRCELAACAMVAGSTMIGDDVFVGPNASLSSELTIGNGAHITIGAVVTRDVAAGRRVSGNFAIDHQRLIAHLRRIR